MVQSPSHRPPASAYLQACVGVAGYRRSANSGCPRRRAIALSWTAPVRRSGSPHPGLTLPPRSPTVHLHHLHPPRGLQARCGSPAPGPRSSGDQGIYLACLPARNIRPSHSPSTWAGPAPAWWQGIVSTHRTSHVRPIQPARPALTIHARPKLSRRACILRGSRTAGGPSRFETQGRDGTADSPELWRAVTSASMWE
jgi:hypothetical protein